ncbi:MAG: hypothetical protein LBM75_01420 [Myxococcales bacterium]|jgi:DNA-binding NarL/FixJ family response regulator|nr:hypothetical protein [Myxococcales bacterium]
MFWQKPKKTMAEFKKLERPQILKRGRTLILDDEEPEILEPLKQEGLTIDHIAETTDPRFVFLEQGEYDVLLLDYGDVGKSFGQQQGLDVLIHLRRIIPTLRIVAFTGRTFDASQADFFRLCDDVLRKDAGIRESMEIIENQLEQALTPEIFWKAILDSLEIPLELSVKNKLEKEIIAAAEEKTEKRERVLKNIYKMMGISGSLILEKLIDKLVTVILPEFLK